jgi:hypothetical protein
MLEQEPGSAPAGVIVVLFLPTYCTPVCPWYVPPATPKMLKPMSIVPPLGIKSWYPVWQVSQE